MKFPRENLAVAANWIGQKEYDEMFGDLNLHDNNELRGRMQAANLRLFEESAESAGPEVEVLQRTFSARPAAGSDKLRKWTVRVYADRVYGFESGTNRAIYAWPPEIAASLRQRWAREDAGR